ncbi:MAG: hypothetical protein ABJP02_11145 [Parasphingorhabdus sp.]|uniref:hypothetical protein n=1 Tax=Parasphingorhabdus sp. TaxID=2709688 RepID=UPI0032972D6C
MATEQTSNPEMQRQEAIENQFVLSESGFVRHGEEIFVPWGTVEDWNLMLSPNHAGVNELGSQNDNALMQFTISARELGNGSGWEISSSSAFRFWDRNDYRDLPVKVQYLMVAK